MAGSERLILLAFSGLFGLIVGSFLNVCIFRLPRNCMSLARGRSRCPRCRAQIAWYDNLPVASWLALRGRCRHCGEPISPRYMAIELITGALFAWAAFVQLHHPHPLHPDAVSRATLYLIQCYLVGAILVSTFIDLDFEILPNEINYSGVLFGLAAAGGLPRILFPDMALPRWIEAVPRGLQFHAAGLLQALGGALVGAGLIYATGVLGTILFRKRVQQLRMGSAMGLGDVKYLAFLGTFLGIEGISFTLLVAIAAGAFFGIAKYAVRREMGKVPFGPFLSLGALAALFLRPQLHELIRAYLRLIRPDAS